MKHCSPYLLMILLLSACCKDKPEDSGNTDVPGLPPATQTGANTFGCLVNGKPWTPQGNNGTANLSIDFDPGFNNGVMGIGAYKIISLGNVQYLGIGIKDSLNFFNPPFRLLLHQNSLAIANFNQNRNCNFWSDDVGTFSNGFVAVSLIDRNKGVVAGTFEATLYKSGCDTIRITEGRFDMRF